MTLVSAVEEVVGDEVELAELAAVAQEDVGSRRQVEEGVGGRGGLGVVGHVVVVLAEVMLYADGHIGVVEDVVEAVVVLALACVVGSTAVVVAVVGELPFHFAGEAWGRGEGQVAGLQRLVELAGIDHRVGGADVQLVEGVDIDAGLEALEEGVALGVAEVAVTALAGRRRLRVEG